MLAPLILKYFPKNVGRLIEPFAGSAAVSIAAAIGKQANSFLINDINTALIDLLKEMVDTPDEISDKYELLWNEQLGNEKEFFKAKRTEFNNSHRSDLFLYILSRCIKGAIRYNANGEFNQSADNRRRGKNPSTMRQEILLLSHYLKNKAEFFSVDYSKILHMATPADIIYMDPPYQGISMSRDQRYVSGLEFKDFVANLEMLNENQISYMISYDGQTGEKKYGEDLPTHLCLHKIMIEAGRSTQATLLGKSDITYEALYLSEALVRQLPDKLPENMSLKAKQLQLI